MKTIAFFNNKGGVGKTSLVFHLSWMLADKGLQVLALDLDPQANLTSMFLGEARTHELSDMKKGGHSATVYGALAPLLEGTGDINPPHVEEVTERINLIPGDLALSLSEDELNSQWPQCLNRNPRAYRVMTAFHRTVLKAGEHYSSDVALIDVGPNLGALNRAAMIAADYVVIPLAPDLFSLQGLTNLGRRLGEWRSDWADRLERAPDSFTALPCGQMKPLGYIVMKHSVRLDRPVKAYEYWMRHIPNVYRESMKAPPASGSIEVGNDDLCLAMLKDYRSLMPLAQRLRKPMFHLQSKDGVFGSNASGVQEVKNDFERLAQKLVLKADIVLSKKGLKQPQTPESGCVGEAGLITARPALVRRAGLVGNTR